MPPKRVLAFKDANVLSTGRSGSVALDVGYSGVVLPDLAGPPIILNYVDQGMDAKTAIWLV